MAAGVGLCHRDVVEFVVSQGADMVHWLLEQGVEFDRRETPKHSEFHLTMEGGHSHRRVIHAADATGKAISGVLVERALARDNVDIFTGRMAVDLVRNGERYVLHYLTARRQQR